MPWRPFVLRDNEGKVHAAGAMRAISFFEQEYVLFGPNGPIPLPTTENVSLSAASEETDVVLFTVSNYLGPTSLWYFDAASEGLEILRTTPPKFNPSRHVAKQFEATSLDGTRIPTFWCVPRM